MTRRVVNHCEHVLAEDHAGKTMLCRHCEHGTGYYNCPYGAPGDRLWVREAWAVGNRDKDVIFAADEQWQCNGVSNPPPCNANTVWSYCWRPSIHMPRWASRITLEITGVRVERVQDISEADARAEGVELQAGDLSYINLFCDLWNSIYDKRGFGWAANPFVWVVEFKRVTP
jgi:hypothetical protein